MKTPQLDKKSLAIKYTSVGVKQSQEIVDKSDSLSPKSVFE